MWSEFFKGGAGGGLFNSMQDDPPGLLQRLLYAASTGMHDWGMGLPWWRNNKTLGHGIYPEQDNLYKEYLERNMWNHINQNYTSPRGNINGRMPLYPNTNRPRTPMGITGRRG